MQQRKPMTTSKLQAMKGKGEPITMVTAYDYPSAYLADAAGVDVLLVGDSLGNVVLGYDTTVPVTLDDMVYHSKAVSRAAQAAFIVTDLPFMTYHGSVDTTLRNAARLMQEGGAKAVKMEGGTELVPVVEACVRAGVPVAGHLGLMPQLIHQIGGYKVQGREEAQVKKLIEDAKALERAGAFIIILELVAEEIAAEVSAALSIPTIGIGSGAGCDGQVLVFHDLLQYGPPGPAKKFVQTYANIGEDIRNGLARYVQDVKTKQFPTSEHAFPKDK